MHITKVVRNIEIRRAFTSMLEERLDGKRKYTVEYICSFLGKKYYLNDRTVYAMCTQMDNEMTPLMEDCLLYLYWIDPIQNLKANDESKIITFVYQGYPYQFSFPSEEITSVEDLEKIMSDEVAA